MPSVYLSPSLQEYNPYIDGGNEEYYMNLIADAMEPYLRASGIDFRRNDPDMTLSQAIADSNKGNHDLHLAIHSNAAPEGSAGRYTGADIYYYPTGSNGKRFAEILQKNYKDIYPEPNDVPPKRSTRLCADLLLFIKNMRLKIIKSFAHIVPFITFQLDVHNIRNTYFF